jgi:hypothetical protein
VNGVEISYVWAADLAVAPGGDVYVLVEIRDPISQEEYHEVRRYSPDGRLLSSTREFRGIQDAPKPLTATPGPSPTAEPTTATPTPTAVIPTATATSVSTTPAATATPTTAPVTPTPVVVRLPIALHAAGLGGD